MVGPAPGPAAMVRWATDADHRHSGGARGAIAGLAFGIGHGCFTDRFTGHDFHSEALRYETPVVGDGSFSVAFTVGAVDFLRSFISADLRR